ncbi:hypothetical protein E2I14_08645 [Sapientia aquatica]|uniref:Glycosyl hydrolase family 32 N-terminal domain-containing protein n=2 Tax=Sapientia aquatica TaxID=1549640 RepID=A0A4R5W2M1_9BURK|nr:hypothetical protein E2I14_08645 [Sapientia aquatica]
MNINRLVWIIMHVAANIKNYKFSVIYLLLMLIVSCRRSTEIGAPVVNSSNAVLPAPTKQLSIVPVKIDTLVNHPVLERGVIGEWDSTDVLNPSVIKFKDKYFNYYSGFDGKLWRTGVAVSNDGISWQKFVGNPVLAPSISDWDTGYIAGNGTAIYFAQRIYYFYQGINDRGIANIGLAVSDDGFHFKKHPNPILATGPAGAWDSDSVGDPFVIEKGEALYLYYLGQDSVGVQRLGIAKSVDGLHWTRLSNNPVLDIGAGGSFDENGLGEPSIAYQPPYFYMFYTGRASDEIRNIGYAISTDGIHWKKISTTGLISNKLRSEWFSKVICDTTLIAVGGGKWAVWFGGGNLPVPAENLNGQIGMLILDLGQQRDMTSFDANSDWSRSLVKSTDVLLGSFEIEGDLGKRSTWLGPKAHLTLATTDHAGNSMAGKPIIVEGWAPAQFISSKTGQYEPLTISISINGKIAAKRTFVSDDMFRIEILWPEIAQLLDHTGFVEMDMSADRAIVPAQFGVSKDSRNLSFKVTRIYFH